MSGTPIEQWTELGQLNKCQNKPHEFRLWRLRGEWQLAASTWGHVTSTGTLHTHYFAFYSVRTLSGVKGYVLNVWRLAIRWCNWKDSPQAASGRQE